MIFYDLTELMVASGGREKYYGIARVVAEIGVALWQGNADVRFVVFSPADRTFYEITPSADAGVAGGVNLNIPRIRLIKLRTVQRRRRFLRDLLLPSAHRLVSRINKARWARANISLQPAILDGHTVISAARPKLMVEMLSAMEDLRWTVSFRAYLHDLIPLYVEKSARVQSFNESFLHDNRYVMTRAAQVIANSEFTRNDILRFVAANVLPAPRSLMMAPLVHECRDGADAPLITVPSEPYVLTVGSLPGRKNLEAGFEAMLVLHEAGKSPPLLVIAGARRRQIEKCLKQKKYRPILPRIRFVINPSQSDLVYLYRAALAVLVPSRIEGWGLPAGEALWNGTPVVCSTTPALREVCGDLGLYFDPDQPAELAEILSQLQCGGPWLEKLRQRIAAMKPTLRRWDHVAQDLLAAVRLPLVDAAVPDYAAA